jgi:hypothetical protein
MISLFHKLMSHGRCRFVAAALLISCLRLLSQAADTNAPLISISVNDSGEAQVFRGMPLLVSVSLINPHALSADAVPVVIGSSQGAWTNSVRVDILDSAGNSQSWPFNSGILPSATIILDSANFGRLDRWLNPDQTLNLSTGAYSLRVVLDTISVTSDGAWHGIVESAPATLEIVDEPATLSEARAENKYSQLANYEMFLNNPTNALNRINQLLADYPTNFAGLRIKAQALDALGRTAEAHTLTAQAIESFYAINTVIQEPPINLLLLQRELEQTLLNPTLRLTVAQNQEVTMDWIGHPSLSYTVENSTNLLAWSLFSTNFNLAPDRYFLTTPKIGENAFFRLSVGNASSSGAR